MEPALRGPSIQWTCPDCGWRHRFCKQSILPDSPFRCPTCNRLQIDPIDLAVESFNAIDGTDRVEYWPRRLMAAKRLSRDEPTEYEGLKRGDLVVLQSPDQSIREIKRVVGFPSERLTIRNGDLWIGDHRWKKSVMQLLQQSALVHANDSREPISSIESEQGSVSDESRPIRPRWTDGSRVLSGTVRLAGAESHESLPLDALAETTLSEASMLNKSLDRSQQHPASSLFFQMGDGGWIDNRFVGNMHDSHALIPVQDLGVALQIENWSEEWVLRIAIRSPSRQWLATIDASDDDWSISSVGKESNNLIRKTDYANDAAWLVIACVDGDGVVSLHDRELLRVELEQEVDSEPEMTASLNSIDNSDVYAVPVEIRCLLGNIEFKQLLVFRDLHYRGEGDSPVQRFDSDEGLVLLGDNVSLSNDSRQRWDTGLGISDIAGVIDERRSGLEHLLRQRDDMPKPTEGR